MPHRIPDGKACVAQQADLAIRGPLDAVFEGQPLALPQRLDRLPRPGAVLGRDDFQPVLQGSRCNTSSRLLPKIRSKAGLTYSKASVSALLTFRACGPVPAFPLLSSRGARSRIR